MSKNDLVPVVTPVGELHWVNISGQGKENYNEDGYNYVATVHLEGDKAKVLRDKIEEVLGEVPKGKTVKSRGYRELMKDKEGNLHTPNKDGEIIVDGENITDDCEASGIFAFTFTTGTTFADGKTKVVSVYNAGSKAGKPQKVNLGERKIGNGSEGAISGKMRRFERGKDIGVSLFLHAVQLTKFNEYEGDAGFDVQEGDFEGVDDAGFESGGDTAEEVPAKKEKAKPKL